VNKNFVSEKTQDMSKIILLSWQLWRAL